MNINEIFSQLAQYTAMLNETSAIVDGLKDEIKRYMDEKNVTTLVERHEINNAIRALLTNQQEHIGAYEETA